MASKSIVKKQVRSFAFAWTFITFIIGVAVFFAIYLTYDAESNPVMAASSSEVGLPERQPQQPDSQDAVVAFMEQPEQAQATPIATISLSDFSAQQTQPLPQATALPVNTIDEFFVGVQVQQSIDNNPEIQRMWMQDTVGMGATWIKQQVRWIEIEPEYREYNWGKLDVVFDVIADFDLFVMLSVVAAPDWARDPGVDLSAEGPPADYEEFAIFLTELMNRYPGQIHAIEVWNEPNIDREWMSAAGVSPSEFVALMRVAFQTIKNIDPGVIVISGAPSPTGGLVQNGVVRAMNDFDYVDQIIAAGVLSYIDCLGVHHNGYNVSPRYRWNEVPNNPDAVFRGPFDDPHHSFSFRSTLETYYNKVAVAGRPDIKLCITEFGWASVEDLDGYPRGFEFALDNSLEEQRVYFVEALDLMEEWGFVWIATIWNLNYGPQAGWSTESDNVPYSLIGPDFVKRPAYFAIAEWTAERNQRN